jgi:hypothetical protein
MAKEKLTIKFRNILFLKSVINEQWFNRFIDITPAEKKELEKQGIVFPKKAEPKTEAPKPKN